jgi:hypothetical protein
MKTLRTWFLVAAAVTSISALIHAQGWPQWGQSPEHSGSVATVGQSPNEALARAVYDPFVAREQAENGGDLLAHYQAPLTDGRLSLGPDGTIYTENAGILFAVGQ